ncbi:hypothetical protein E6Q11_04000 [Candidatus Dojkabacteria bacterium]|uniref:Uncharacterized protein n=1 Tax=Candidatus Dojkabacteria bacterium TaxID=2099670 RepID=A0A5C7J8I0_9BACT|nr:MAG: hypothetical protein E6Q11_04000 [Candidatus Dojkabacteria bacterium]
MKNMEQMLNLLPKNFREFVKYFVYAIVLIALVALGLLYTDLRIVHEKFLLSKDNEIKNTNHNCLVQYEILVNERDYLRLKNKDYEEKNNLITTALSDLIKSREKLNQLNQLNQTRQ